MLFSFTVPVFNLSPRRDLSSGSHSRLFNGISSEEDHVEGELHIELDRKGVSVERILDVEVPVGSSDWLRG